MKSCRCFWSASSDGAHAPPVCRQPRGPRRNRSSRPMADIVRDRAGVGATRRCAAGVVGWVSTRSEGEADVPEGQGRSSSTSSSSAQGRAATPARCARPSSGSASPWSRRTSSAAPACTSAASRPRRCCTRPRSPTRARESEQFGVQATLDGIDMAGGQRLQGRRGRPAVQGPAGPGQGPRHHRHRGRRPARPDPRTVEVDGIDVRPRPRPSCSPAGSYSRSLPGLEIDGERVITSEQALRLDRVPGVGDRARRRRHRVRVRERLALLRRRRHDRRGAAPPARRSRTSSRPRRSSARSASAGSPSPPAPASSR